MPQFNDVVRVSGSAFAELYARNYSPNARPLDAIIPLEVHANALINGVLTLRASAYTPLYGSSPDPTIAEGLVGDAAVETYARGNAAVDGEVRLHVPKVAAAELYGYGIVAETDLYFEPLTGGGSEGPYASASLVFDPLGASAEGALEPSGYAEAVLAFEPLYLGAIGLTGSVSLDPSESTFAPLGGLGSEGSYAAADLTLAPLDGLAIDDTVELDGGTFDQPSGELIAFGSEYRGIANLTQPSIGELTGYTGGSLIHIAPRHKVTLDATFPIIGRATLTQPRSLLEATALTGSIGSAYLTQPRSELNGRDAWRLSLVQPGAALVVEATFGEVGHAELSQPRTVLTAAGGEANYGRAELEQPAGRLGYTGLLVVEQPRAYLAASGGEQVEAPVYVAYAVNLAHFGVTEYTNYGFRRIVEFNGEYFGITGQGLYRLSADTDAGTAITSIVETARPDFGSSQDKRVTYSYMLLDTRDTLDVTPVTGERTGYTQQAKGSGRTGKHNRRVQFGRGMKARNWGLRLEHSGEDRFALEEIEFVGEVLRRKVGG